MKIVALFFSLLFVGMSAMQCADNNQDAHAQVEFHESADGHEHDENEDFCSPLCSCNCCHTNITLPTILTFVPEILFSQKLTSFIPEYPSSFYYAFWQPPNKGRIDFT